MVQFVNSAARKDVPQSTGPKAVGGAIVVGGGHQKNMSISPWEMHALAENNDSVSCGDRAKVLIQERVRCVADG
jgi:hypothetical protein